MILALDVYYNDKGAKSVGVLFEKWEDTKPKETIIENIEKVEEYESGQFYKRELPCLIKIIDNLDLNTIEFIVIDGYVYLDNEGKKGLGAHLFDYYLGKIPVIGVAKTNFMGNDKKVVDVLRGESKNPLKISAVGLEKEKAAEFVKCMAGEYRFPDILKYLDQCTKVSIN